MWLRNCWYVIAWDHEIPAADSPQLFTRVVLNARRRARGRCGCAPARWRASTARGSSV